MLGRVLKTSPWNYLYETTHSDCVLTQFNGEAGNVCFGNVRLHLKKILTSEESFNTTQLIGFNSMFIASPGHIWKINLWLFDRNQS